MERKEFIAVNVISLVLKEEAENKIIGFSGDSKKDEHGYDLEFYETLGVPPPEELLKGDDLEFDDDDYVEIINEARIRPEQISFMVNEEEKGATIYMETDYKISVIETVEQIEEKINQAKNGN